MDYHGYYGDSPTQNLGLTRQRDEHHTGTSKCPGQSMDFGKEFLHANSPVRYRLRWLAATVAVPAATAMRVRRVSTGTTEPSGT